MILTTDSPDDLSQYLDRMEVQKCGKLYVRVQGTNHIVGISREHLFGIVEDEGTDRLRGEFEVDGISFWWVPNET